MWQMKSPAMSCFFCVMLLFQIAHAESLDVSTWDQVNHNILIVLTILVSILLFIVIAFSCYIICSVKRSKDPERGLLIPDNSKVNRSKDPERGLLIPDNSKGLLIPDNSKGLLIPDNSKANAGSQKPVCKIACVFHLS
ncbi:uncharacterized protein LOC101751153 isoform X18 [Gallus gallus]|uniref:uncharacterized protein LOC101751153 isoform X18 n=1 Tax=Gallus gallus TaxID=9031 RepID=UPI001AE599F8|nr:uncharacterized protein LOC101751153 isoform X18 [Gallus gallus]